ncbi:nitroreductase family deazaflavin-dependent oxidoreductase [Amycolatopsis magusensis]|uniref:Deazaflavin-dependent oxidoreductase (Nitroreductase family) n=1 Tax=Amycolatopsis magusensis TaxID=882444 RepID=A0ABS4PVB8_9PSEU|nr:nitroreductase family deazaflavin-dependent oxidoreductase [Amycolatopsis magusensis]MBP2183379.1 deazaflavin-dependent oxidoreductase (nitroreductase family) [Amycolatopsis magusensis]MDI5979421.1 nitroreductase family deazaflavin-dependent oxidoreductase [Amycolatopsis magusensis]
MSDFNTQVIEEFRENEGRVGGPFAGAPLLLLHHVGARSGRAQISPLMYLADDDRYLVFASNGGADQHPAWYHNLRAKPDTEIEVGTDRFAVHAEEITGAERDELYARQAELYPGFAKYQEGTSRVIPVVALSPAKTSGA